MRAGHLLIGRTGTIAVTGTIDAVAEVETLGSPVTDRAASNSACL